MVINKRAQFFLLAAVIISAVVISLGVTTNRADFNKEPGNFYDFSYEVKREAGALLDYEIYSNIEGGDLEDFVVLLEDEIKDKNPTANFKIVYGDNTKLTERDSTESGSGAKTVSSIRLGGYSQDVSYPRGEYDPESGVTVYTNNDIGDNEDFSVDVDGHEFSFPISKHKQVFFIMQRGEGDENFITIR